MVWNSNAPTVLRMIEHIVASRNMVSHKTMPHKYAQHLPHIHIRQARHSTLICRNFNG